MDYADQINSFLSNYSETKNDFEAGAQAQIQKGNQKEQEADIEFAAVTVKQAVAEDVIGFAKNIYGKLTSTAAPEDGIEMTDFAAGATSTTSAAGAAGATGAGAGAAGATGATTSATVVTDAGALGADAGVVASFGVAEGVLGAIPLIGTVATVITAIVSLLVGAHEHKNANSDFTMPQSDVNLPSYHPGIN